MTHKTEVIGLGRNAHLVLLTIKVGICTGIKRYAITGGINHTVDGGLTFVHHLQYCLMLIICIPVTSIVTVSARGVRET